MQSCWHQRSTSWGAACSSGAHFLLHNGVYSSCTPKKSSNKHWNVIGHLYTVAEIKLLTWVGRADRKVRKPHLLLNCPLSRARGGSMLQGHIAGKHVKVPAETGGIWIFGTQANAASEDLAFVGHLLHSQWLVNTSCHYMSSSNYWAIIPANYLLIKRRSLVWAAIWEAAAVPLLHWNDHILWRRPNAFKNQWASDPVIKELNYREGIAPTLVQTQAVLPR